MKTIIGIDPGSTGALTVVFPNHIKIYDLPTAATDGFKGIDPIEFKRLLDTICVDAIDVRTGNSLIPIVYCEKSILPPGNGKMTTRSVYDCRGVIRAVLALCGIPLKYVPSQTWKKFHGIPPKSDKEYSRGLCKQIRPDIADQLTRKKDHNRAESVLIALYGVHKEK